MDIPPSTNGQTEPGQGGFFSREAIGGMPWMVASKLALFFVYFGVSVLTVNGLGKERYGVYSLFVNIATYLVTLCGLGLGAALMRYVPELAARRNRNGLIHLLWKSAALQLAAVALLSALLLVCAGPLQRLFRAGHVEHFRLGLLLACALCGLLLLKEFVGNVFTAIFKTRTVALLSVAQGAAWLALLWPWLADRPTAETALLAQMASIGAIYLLGLALLATHIKSLPWDARESGIGRKRTLLFSGSVLLSTLLRMVMFKYSEVFFLAAVGGTTLAGLYDLGYSLPYTAVTFIPLALMPLFTSAFAEAYVRDNACLPRLIGAYYKLLMMVSLPVAVLGAFFAPNVYRIAYRGEMDEAGGIAAAFCLVLILPLISMPLSAAIKAKEMVLHMVPMLLLQIAVNLVLDWLFIVEWRWGVWGGIAAVAGTFFLTIPFRLRVVRRLLGGVYFPTAFFLRIAAALTVEGALFHAAVSQANLFGRCAHPWANAGLLFLVGGLYLGLFLLLARTLRLVRHDDIADFEALGIPKLNRLLHLLVR